MFQETMDHLKEVTGEQLMKARVAREEAVPVRTALRLPGDGQEGRGGQPAVARRPPTPQPRTPEGGKIGRNAPCPCGSGKKYKKCCLLKGT
jgi:preprotein translocase subunit SecA